MFRYANWKLLLIIALIISYYRKSFWWKHFQIWKSDEFMYNPVNEYTEYEELIDVVFFDEHFNDAITLFFDNGYLRPA